jgi:hypothetical protein
MFIKAISKKIQTNLEILSQIDFMNYFYLAGGTGCALQLGHRTSLDLDFFTRKELYIFEIKPRLKEITPIKVILQDKNTLTINFKGTKISFFSYNYPLLFKFEEISGINIANIYDIGCMKIDTVSSRGKKRDFIDLYFICQEKGLKYLLYLFKKKYKGINYNLVHIFKSLNYFQDAENDLMPEMIKKISWERVKRYFISETRKLLQ